MPYPPNFPLKFKILDNQNQARKCITGTIGMILIPFVSTYLKDSDDHALRIENALMGGYAGIGVIYLYLGICSLLDSKYNLEILDSKTMLDYVEKNTEYTKSSLDYIMDNILLVSFSTFVGSVGIVIYKYSL